MDLLTFLVLNLIIQASSLSLNISLDLLPIFQDCDPDCNQLPEKIPSGIQLSKTNYINWAEALTVNNLWIFTPKDAAEVVTMANWAYSMNYTLRANGFMHNWSPLTVDETSNCKNVILVNTTAYLTSMEITAFSNTSWSSVKTQTGVSMTTLLTFLEVNGLGVYNTPAPGDLTVGGVLAIDGHGTSIPAVNETVTPGHSYGTLSNLIICLTAVVWNSTLQSFNLKTFQRSDPEAKAFLVHLGRTFITEVTLMVGLNYNLRCISRIDIPYSELFADPATANSNNKTFASFLDQTGRVEAIWFAFTDNPWIKIWSVTENKPAESREVSSPFNYVFSDNLPQAVTDLGKTLTSIPNSTLVFSNMQYTIAKASLINPVLNFHDIWGPSKNLLLYVKPTTLHVTANGYAINTFRSNIQKVINTFTTYYETLLQQYAKNGKYPINGPVEIRVTGVDLNNMVAKGDSPAISAVRPINVHPEFDVAVWLDILSLPKTKNLEEFMTNIESFLYNTFNGTDAIVRPEWSKGWAYTNQSAWSNITVMQKVRDTFPNESEFNGWNWVVSTFDKYDPYRIFANPFLNKLLVNV